MAQSRTKRQLATAGATFAVALSIGFVMQYGDAVASRWGSDAPVAGPNTRIDPETVMIPVAASVAVPTTFQMPSANRQQSTPVSYSEITEELDAPLFVVPNSDDEAIEAAAEPADIIDILPLEESEVAQDCKAVLTATPTDLAMVSLSLSNPCRPDAVVAIHHQGLMFNAITDENGKYDVTVPALATEAFFIAAYSDGDGAVAITGVPSLSLYDRAVLQWQGEDDVQLHALEFGAEYGQPGHVWSQSAADPKQAVAGLGGFLTRLGSDSVGDGLMAEVYTFPSGITLQDGQVALSVEAEVTGRNCGRLVEAQSIQIVPGSEAESVDLVMTMPDCDAVGEYLVLKNMFEDLTLAAK